MILGRNSLLKFVSILKYNNISKLQYPMNPESPLYIMSALANQNIYPIRRVIQRNQAETCFKTSVVVQWLCLLTLKG